MCYLLSWDLDSLEFLRVLITGYFSIKISRSSGVMSKCYGVDMRCSSKAHGLDNARKFGIKVIGLLEP